MKTAYPFLLLAIFLITACEKEENAPVELKGPGLILNLVEGEIWTYQVDVTLDPSARNASGQLKAGSEGVVSSYEKVRRYLGLKPIEADSEELAHCFEVSEGGKVKELEFCLIDERGVLAVASQKNGEQRFIMAEPFPMIPVDKVPGSAWSFSLPDTNDPGGAPMISRDFQYFGEEELTVLGEVRKAHRIRLIGKTGKTGQFQRDYWFVNQLGFVKERKSRFVQGKRLALFEESLISHERPK